MSDEIDLIISFDHINPEKSKTKCLAFGVKNDPPPFISEWITYSMGFEI